MPPQTAIFSIAFFPPVHFFEKLLKAQHVFIERHETYRKQTYRNRCEIYTANGRLSLTIPVNKVHGNHTRVDQIRISDRLDWQILHWRAITAAYANSPYFLYYGDLIKELLFCREEKLFDYNLLILKMILQMLGVKKEIQFTDSFIKNYDEIADYRNIISPKSDQSNFNFKTYYQTFGERFGYIAGLSVLDLLFNLGPESRSFLLT